MPKTYVYVDQHTIKNNRHEPVDFHEPPLLVVKNKCKEKAFTAIILDEHGVESARIVYNPERPMNGARVWIETLNKVVIDEDS